MTDTAQKLPTHHSYKVGDITVTVVHDGIRMIPVSDNLILNASADDINAALAVEGLPPGQLRNPFSPIVLTTDGKRVLFDTGNGEAQFAESKGERGRLFMALDAAGIGREAIDVVVISHFHADHVNGLLAADNARAFPNAEIKVPAVEWSFWMNDEEMARAPQGRMADLFKNNRRVFDRLERKVTVYEWDSEVVPGVTAVGTPGHSIGHTSFMVQSGTDRVFMQSDLTINNPALFVRHPGWHPMFDQDPVQGEASRRRIYEMLSAEKIMVQAFHFPFPGTGHIEKLADGYRFVPLKG
jgi:glyoxylase-like metal-dependent hydrolase (beta-lactamase superfamily II)